MQGRAGQYLMLGACMRDARKCLILRLWPNQLQQRCEEGRVHGKCKEVFIFKAVAEPTAAEMRRKVCA